MKKSELRQIIREEFKKLNETDMSKNFEVSRDYNGEYSASYTYNGFKTIYLGDKNSVKKIIKKLEQAIK
jgi:transcriptional regulator of NAD metabolism